MPFFFLQIRLSFSRSWDVCLGADFGYGVEESKNPTICLDVGLGLCLGKGVGTVVGIDVNDVVNLFSSRCLHV